MGIWILKTLAVSLVLTVILGLGFGMILGIRNLWDMTLMIFVNLLANPVVVFPYYVNLLYMGQSRAAVTAVLGIGAAVAEGLCYRAAPRRIRHPWLFSTGVNLFSSTMGTTITSLADRQNGKVDTKGRDGRQKQKADAKGGNRRQDQRTSWRK